MEIESRIAGCLLGGAVGDALGNDIEFMSIARIRGAFGTAGVVDMSAGAHFTDDTQMTLFTCEGLIRSRSYGRDDVVASVTDAYQRWLHTQGRTARAGTSLDGWLVAERRLHRQEAPGMTCLGALERGQAVKDSKGCGGVMRAAPAGFATAGDVKAAYEIGCKVAAITHGHPEGWSSAGGLAAIVAVVVGGATLRDAVDQAIPLVTDETARLLRSATKLAERGIPEPEDIETQLGGGWVGEQALAIAVCCALATDDVRAGLRAAVNHSGDSDSTGAICGNLFGAVHGRDAVPTDWLERVDAIDVVETMAADLAAEVTGSTTDWADRYPRH